MRRGAFITLEGIEGVGKSTCMSVAQRTLTARGHDTLVTREPGGTPIGEALRGWVLDGAHGPLTADIEALLMFAARALHVTDVIEPALGRGRWVLCDRFTDATFAYQGGGRGADRAFLERLAGAVQGEIKPNLTLLLDAPVEIGLARISGRAADHFEREDRAFFGRVRSAYLDLAAREPERIRIIDATRPLAEVEAAVARSLETFAQAHAHREADRR